MTFVEWYFDLKDEGKQDKEIAEMLDVCTSTLKRMKNIHGIGKTTRIRPNGQGLTEEQLKIADEKGITRRLALRRVREYGWDKEDAISIPKGLWSSKGGYSEEEKKLRAGEEEEREESEDRRVRERRGERRGGSNK